MCVMSSSKPKVEQVAPAPQSVPVSETDSAAVNNRIAADNKRKRNARGVDWARNLSRDAVLTDAAQSGNRQTLG